MNCVNSVWRRFVLRQERRHHAVDGSADRLRCFQSRELARRAYTIAGDDSPESLNERYLRRNGWAAWNLEIIEPNHVLLAPTLGGHSIGDPDECRIVLTVRLPLSVSLGFDACAY